MTTVPLRTAGGPRLRWTPGAFRGARGGPARGSWETSDMRITVLAGGVGGARFLRGLKAAAPDAEITVIGNNGDDISLFGLHVSPDPDTVMDTPSRRINQGQGLW